MASTRPFCISCKKVYISWGKTASGRKRYRCPGCGISRKYQQKQSLPDIFALFRHYILWGLTYEMLSSISGLSVRYLEREFHKFLEQEPPQLPLLKQDHLDETFLLIDGLWFTRLFVLMAYRQSGNLFLLRIAIYKREVNTKIKKDLIWIRSQYRFTGVVSDGGKGIVKAVGDIFPHAPHQICLAHLHRDMISGIGQYPRDERIKELKRLADHVWLIESKEALHWWEDKVKLWIISHHTFLKEKRYDLEYNSWYIHKGVRSAVSIMRDLPKTSFKFLDYPLMPKTTNEIEAQFGHLGKRWLAHRGLKKERWVKFLGWFVYFYNVDKMT